MVCVLCVCVWLVAVAAAKEYAMRDSNPQPPDSKSDTLSIAPTAPPKRLKPHTPTQTRIKRTHTHTTHNTHIHTTHSQTETRCHSLCPKHHTIREKPKPSCWRQLRLVPHTGRRHQKPDSRREKWRRKARSEKKATPVSHWMCVCVGSD